MAIRVGNYAQHSLILSQTLKTQATLYDRQDQLSTGKVSRGYQPIASDTRRLVTVETQLSRAEQYMRNIDVLDKRITLMNTVVEQISEVARDMRGLLSQRSGDSKSFYENDLAIPRQAENMRDLVVDLLNTRDDSRYLFAGGRIDVRPVQLDNGTYSAPSAPPMPTTADTSWYEGDAVVQEIRVDTNVSISYGVTADDAGFEKIIRALDTLANLTFSDPVTAAERQVLEDTQGLLNTAVDEVKLVENDLALNSKRLEDTRDRQESFINFTKNIIGDIENIDTAEVIAELNAAEVQLQASYTTLSRVQRLSLANFI
ncbi:MAG: flagellin [Alphaproteobacteria bacterium]